MQLCLDNENEMNARIYTFPGSMLKINDRKINYYDYIHGPHHDGLDHALSQLVPLIKAARPLLWCIRINWTNTKA